MASPASLTFLTTEELSALLKHKVKPRTLEDWRRRGIGPDFIPLPKGVLYRLDVVDEWLAARSRQTRANAA